MIDGMVLETRPTLDQQRRLSDFLHELRLLSAKYGVLIDSYISDKPVLRDLTTDGTVIGVDLVYYIDAEYPDRVTAYECDGGAVYDGVWPVETADGRTVELREVDGRDELRRRRGVPREKTP